MLDLFHRRGYPDLVLTSFCKRISLISRQAVTPKPSYSWTEKKLTHVLYVRSSQFGSEGHLILLSLSPPDWAWYTGTLCGTPHCWRTDERRTSTTSYKSPQVNEYDCFWYQTWPKTNVEGLRCSCELEAFSCDIKTLKHDVVWACLSFETWDTSSRLVMDSFTMRLACRTLFRQLKSPNNMFPKKKKTPESLM